jgi:hypothetical protein
MKTRRRASQHERHRDGNFPRIRLIDLGHKIKVIAMADDKSKRGAQDRARVAGEQGYEVDYFANKHGISREQAEQLIRQIGNDRARLDEAARKLKGR